MPKKPKLTGQKCRCCGDQATTHIEMFDIYACEWCIENCAIGQPHVPKPSPS